MPPRLEVRVDGARRARWQVSEQAPLDLRLAGAVELIELIARDERGELPLAALLVPFEASTGRAGAADLTIELPGSGWQLALRLTPVAGNAAEAAEEAGTLVLRLELGTRHSGS
ncbi:MAG: hypothetical protein MI919_36210 [Holophagales bacterium]|nr:hypothetical protein [Holophagales bacterium]